MKRHELSLLLFVLAVILFLVFMCSGCGPPMTKGQKIRLGIMVATNLWDYEASRRLHLEDSDGKIIGDQIVTFSERNLFLNDHPSRDQIALAKGLFVAAMWLLGEIDPENGSREFFYGVGAGVGSFGGWHNDRMYDKYH